ncbi:MAG: BON domain-containing protein [Verrucomicrobiota bacterium]
MHHVARCRIIPVVLIGWIALSAWGLSAMLRGKIEHQLESKVSAALQADPALAHITPKFDGFSGALEGKVGAEQLKELATQIAANALPAGEIVENQVTVADKSATIRAKLEGAVIVLEGEVADSKTRDDLVAAIREINVVDDVQAQQLQISPEVRSITWAPNLVEFLPKFMNTCDEGVAEATDEIWALAGSAPGAVKHNELKAAWRTALPEDAVADFEGLKLAEEPPEVPDSTGSPTVAVGTQNSSSDNDPEPQNPEPQNTEPQNPDPQNSDPQNPEPQNPEPEPNNIGSNTTTQNPEPKPDPNEPEPEPNTVTQNTPPESEPDSNPEEMGPPEPPPKP